VKIANMGECVPKFFHGLEHDNRKGRSFFREVTVYRHLLHEGVCAVGVMPYCYGYTVINPTQWKMPRTVSPLCLENDTLLDNATSRWNLQDFDDAFQSGDH